MGYMPINRPNLSGLISWITPWVADHTKWCYSQHQIQSEFVKSPWGCETLRYWLSQERVGSIYLTWPSMSGQEGCRFNHSVKEPNRKINVHVFIMWYPCFIIQLVKWDNCNRINTHLAVLWCHAAFASQCFKNCSSCGIQSLQVNAAVPRDYSAHSFNKKEPRGSTIYNLMSHIKGGITQGWRRQQFVVCSAPNLVRVMYVVELDS